MRACSSNGRLFKALQLPSLHLQRFFFASDLEKLGEFHAPFQWQSPRNFPLQVPRLLGTNQGALKSLNADIQHLGHHPMFPMIARACFSSEANKVNGNPTEGVQELYHNMLKSVEAETMPPNAWLWSLIEKCANREDIQLLFQILQNLRRFRLSNLRIHANFNSQLCLKVAEACACVGAIDFGKKTLWKHNVYGITPSIGSAHYLLLYAKKHNDAKLMVKILQIMKKNSLQLQPTTADIVFSICYNTDNWNLILKLSENFIKSGLKLHRTAFDIWMEFAAKMGDATSIWKIEELRSKSGKQHTLASAFSCAKGYLLEHQPDNAAAIIHVLNQNLPDSKKPLIEDELQKLVSKWPSDWIKRKRKEDRKALAASLKDDILAMVGSLMNMGLAVTVNLDDAAIPC